MTDHAPADLASPPSGPEEVPTVSIRLYGRLAEELQPELSHPASEASTVGELRRRLAARYGVSRLLDPHVRVAVGERFADDLALIRAGDTVDILSPLSGG